MKSSMNGERPPARGVVGVGDAARAERAGHHLVVADHRLADAGEQWRRRWLGRRRHDARVVERVRREGERGVGTHESCAKWRRVAWRGLTWPDLRAAERGHFGEARGVEVRLRRVARNVRDWRRVERSRTRTIDASCPQQDVTPHPARPSRHQTRDRAHRDGERHLSLVPPAGFEPAAFCSGGRRSIP